MVFWGINREIPCHPLTTILDTIAPGQPTEWWGKCLTDQSDDCQRIKRIFCKVLTSHKNLQYSHNMSPLIVSFFCKSRDDLAGNLRRWWFWWKALQLIGRYFHILPCGGSTANSGDVYCTFQQDLTISICSKKDFTTKYNFPICVCHLGEAIMQDCFSKKT